MSLRALVVVVAALGVGAWFGVGAVRRGVAGSEEAKEDASPASERDAVLLPAARDGGDAVRRRARLIADAASADIEVARTAILALNEGFERAKWTPEELWRIATLGSTSPIARRLHDAAVERLLGDEHEKALPRLLLAAVRSTDENERRLAADLLRRRPVVDESLIPDLRAIVVDDTADYGCRKALLASIEKLGPKAAALAPELLAWMRRVEVQRAKIDREPPFTCHLWDAVEFEIQNAISAGGVAALPVVLRALDEPKDPDAPFDSVRYVLLRAVAEMPPDAADALRGLLTGADEEVRTAALEALLRPKDGVSPAALAAARAALRDPSAKMRKAAIEGLARTDSIDADDLVRALSDPSPDVRSAAGTLLEKHPAASRAVLPRLLEMLRSPEYADQLTAAGLLPALGEAGLAAIPDLVQMRAHVLDDSLYRDSGPALEALLALGPAGASRIVAVATTSTGDVRHAALDALRRLDGVGGAQLAPLAADLDRLQGVARMDIAAALAHTGDARAQAVLVEGLSSEALDVRVAAARGLAESSIASPGAADVLAALERDAGKRLHAPDAVWGREWRPYYAYHTALLRTGRAVPAAMVPLLSDASGDVRTTAAEALGSAGAEGVAVVVAAWARLDAEAKRIVLGDLVVVSQKPVAGLPELGRRALADADPAVRLRAAEVFERLPDFESAVIIAWIDLLPAPMEIASAACFQLERAAARLGPHAERLRETKGITDPDVTRRVRDLLDALDATRKAAR